MKKAVCLLAAVLAVCICVSAGLLCWMQKDKNSIPVQLETLQGDAGLLDGVYIEADLYNDVISEFRRAGGGVWKQTITFENGQPQVENSFSPQLREFRHTAYQLPSVVPVGINSYENWDKYQTVESLEAGEYRLAAVVPCIEKDGSRLIDVDGFFMEQGTVDGFTLEIPVPADAVLTVEEGKTDGQAYKQATYPDVYLPEIQAQGVELSDGGLLFTLPDTGLMDLCWEPSETTLTNPAQDGHWTSMASGGADGEVTAPEELPPADYTLHSGVFFLPGEPESLDETADSLFALDCTRTGSHILGMCSLTDSQAALLTIENGWYSVRLVSVPDGAVGDAVPLQPWNGEAVNEAQLQAQDGMLLVRINVTENDNMQNWFFAVDCTGQPSLAVWYTDASEWNNGYKASGNSRWELLWHDERLLAVKLESEFAKLVLLGSEGVACHSNLYSYGSMPMLQIPSDYEQTRWIALPLVKKIWWDTSTMKAGLV